MLVDKVIKHFAELAATLDFNNHITALIGISEDYIAWFLCRLLKERATNSINKHRY